MKKLTNNSFSKQTGFTLIELVVVIVILGILAATAAPKFIDLTGDARGAVIKGVQGSVNSAINMAHAKALVSNQTGATGEVTVNGEVFALVYGYPTAAGAGTPAGTAGNGWGVNKLIDLDDGTAITYAAGVFSHSGTTACKVTYTNASKTGAVVTPAKTALDVTSC
ncbi:prepilin-type N-terminal cleavage/methylation domain-containing protein [Colwellia sp. BRX10-3]|uniref:pilus assembly FimT family protein n=1 Tax=Colwellia sp. BRX10-3 TaxID=2759844 RepID=UPI0015F744F0|nr:prepilin-type N-terminal cleavage/methylation domain-containing protein [Colwellia sp. BRX10-3]MBA6389745.1 prepilin-type N-terminal cleavage/methylation domain-containing protein [Colwellia sp. BRX10-3]